MPKFEPLKLPGAFLITLEPVGDNRGYFVETYRQDLFAEHGLATNWVQENQSLSSQKGTVRGLHFQRPPHTEAKLVRVLQGIALDVIVDLRVDSPTYGQYEAIELSESNHRLLYIPKGFGHGFCTLSENMVISYKVDAYYAPGAASGILWNDPDVAIDWPVTHPIMSERDKGLGTLAEFESPFSMP
ncbi:MAG: dTDP-4-dehydrorhamnose 3,5-epimerase [Anaerolineaceae bacterium]|nr:dTDP-4-dehydrorhamnose 3,5-epimerase [Anaerolineaceae bacterium]